MILRVQVNNAVRNDGLRLVHQSKKGFVEPVRFEALNADFMIPIEMKDGVWAGPSVHKYGDKRPFVYFTWLSPSNQIVARIKLYQAQIPEGVEQLEMDALGKSGAPACSTANIVNSS